MNHYLEIIINFATALNPLDYVSIFFLLSLVLWGFSSGLIKAVGAVLSVFVAAIATRYAYEPTAHYLTKYWSGFSEGYGLLLIFFLTFLVIGKVFNFFVFLVDKIFDFLAFIPFLRSLNRLLGAFFGLLLGVLLLAVIFYVVNRFRWWTVIDDLLISSFLFSYLDTSMIFIGKLFPAPFQLLPVLVK